MTVASVKVPFTSLNIKKCICLKCPVQMNSRCVSEKRGNVKAALGGATVNPGDVPAVYCATGVASCGDLDMSRACICGNCAVYAGYGLAGGRPKAYFCRDGASR